MIWYLARRIGWALIVLWVVVTLSFAVTVLSPVDPVRSYVGLRATREEYERARREFGLDEPVPVQYVRYVARLLQGDMGTSFINQQPVLRNILNRLPFTAVLAFAAMLIAVAIGVPLGLWAALRHRSRTDRSILLVSLVGAMVPAFLLGYGMLYVFSFELRLLPLGGTASPAALILPALTLGLPSAAWYVRMMRSESLTILQSDYIRLARAKGMDENVVIRRHLMRNAAAPIVAMVALDFGAFFGGVLVVEKVFAWPGVGQSAWQAITFNDQPMVVGTVLIAAAFVTVFNLSADVFNAWIDPRARYA
jgi:ABC-type dipeptide/oligopeptide/nickel transport system permease component